MKNIKRVSILLLSFILAALPAAAFAEDGPLPAAGPGDGLLLTSAQDGETIAISSAENLMMALSLKPDGKFVLASDIDLAGVDWTPLEFSGTLDGAGHSIYNLKVTRMGDSHADTLDGNAKVYDSVFAGLFSVLKGATIENLKLQGVDIDVSSSRHCFAGTLAGYINGAVIRNCSILDARVSITPTCQPEAENKRTSCNSGVGGIAGFGSGTIENCTADTVLIFKDQCSSQLKVEEFLGGAVSCGNPTLTKCNITVNGYAECRGYAHNGGLVGMYYQFDKSQPVGTITDCHVEGQISFFEDNRDRRAYCKPIVGELMNWPKMTGNTSNFKNNETMNYKAVLSPEKCESPSYTNTVLEGSCDSLGCTVHTCSVCGNSWKDSFTPKVHQPGEWQLASEPSGGKDGLKQRFCTKCGSLAEEEILYAVHEVSFNSPELKLSYKDGAQLKALVFPTEATYQKLVWKSSDESVATVDQEGNIYAAGRGSAEISCSTEDGYAAAKCKVDVDYTVKQWLIKVLLFGWIWY